MRPSRVYLAVLGVLAATTACSQEPPTVATPGREPLTAPNVLQSNNGALQRETQQGYTRRDTDQRRDTDRRDTDRRGYRYRYYFPYYFPYYRSYYPYYPPYYQRYGQNTVVIRGYQYMPGNINVPIGTTVTWINEDSVAHTVTSPLPGQVTTTGYFDGVLQPGQSYSYTFNLPGRIDYYCRYHPNMRGSVTVGGYGGGGGY